MKKLTHFVWSIFAVITFLGFSIELAQAGPCKLPEFNIDNFGSPPAPPTNQYFPRPLADMTYEYEAETEDEIVLNIIYISTDNVTIMGVICTVVYDTEWVYVEEFNQWFMTETTEDWHAWDNSGNFWYFGEWTTEFEYDDNWNYIRCNHDGSWEADGVDVWPGIIVPANPTPGTCYQQEYDEDEAEDRGRVLRLNAKVSIDYDDFEDCLVMKEWTKLDPGNIEHKYYAPGVGLVYIEELKEKTVFVELVDKYTGPPDLEGLPGPPATVCP